MSIMHIIQPPESAAARTLARRLDRAGMAQDFGQGDTDWLATLASYEEVVNKGLRMATFLLTDELVQHGAQETADERAYRALAESVAAFDAHGAVAAAMIAKLGAVLDRIEALPLDDAAGQIALAGRYLACRYGPLPTPRPPGAWPWRDSLRGWHMAGWGVAIVCRQAYRILGREQRGQAVEDFGPFTDADNSDNPLWSCHFPATEELALDDRAARLGIDVRAKQERERRGYEVRRRSGRGAGQGRASWGVQR